MLENDSEIPQNGSNGFQFSFSNPSTKAIYITLYTINFLLTLTGNLTLITVIALSKRMRNTTNLFLLNLAIADFMQGIICIMPALMNQISYNWIYGAFPCKLMRFSSQLSYSASVLLMLAVALERYRILMNPWIPSSRRVSESILFFRISTVMGWSGAAIIAFPKFLFAETRQIGDKGYCVYHHHFHMRIYNLFNFICLYIIPLGILSLVYGRIIRILSNSINSLTNKRKPNVHYANGQCQLSLNLSGDHNKSLTNHNGTHNVNNNNNNNNNNNSNHNSVADNQDTNSSSTPTHTSGSHSGGPQSGISFDAGCHSANVTKSSFVMATATATATTGSQYPNEDGGSGGFGLKHGQDRYCNGHVDRPLGTHHDLRTTSVNVVAANDRIIRSRLRVIHLLLTITVIFAVLVLPYHLRYFLVDNFHQIYVPFQMGPASILLFNLQTAFNPIVYICCSHKFRRALINLICQKRRHKATARFGQHRHLKR